MIARPRMPSISRALMLTIALAMAGAALAGFFGLRAYHAYDRFQHNVLAAGTSDVEAIRGWMTLPYIARAYDVPEDALFEALGFPKAGNERSSVKQLITRYQRDPLATRRAIQQVLLGYQLTPTTAPRGAP
jgi:hypothetical protein